MHVKHDQYLDMLKVASLIEKKRELSVRLVVRTHSLLVQGMGLGNCGSFESSVCRSNTGVLHSAQLEPEFK